MLNAAIVGMGWWGKVLVESVQGKSDAIRFVHGVTYEPEDIIDFANLHDLNISTRFEDVLENPDIQLVVLATPHSTHSDQICAAAAAGKHVFCEKPFALNKADAERAVAACKAANVVLGLGQNRRLWPAIAEIKRMIEAGELGKIVHLEGNYSHDWLAEPAPAAIWRNSPTEAPAASMTGMGIHLMDSFIHLVGGVDTVVANCVSRVLDRPTGDTISVLLRFKEGVTGYFGTTFITPYIWRIHVFGSQGWVESRDENHLLVCRSGGEPEERILPELDTVRLQLENFSGAVNGTEDFHIPTEDMIENAATLEAIFRAAESGEITNVG